MAVARRVEIAVAEDGLVAVQRDVIIDPKRGFAAEREKVTLAVDVGDGKVAVVEETRVKAVAVPNDPPPRFQPVTTRLTSQTTPLMDSPQPTTFQVSTAPRRDQSLLHSKEKDSGYYRPLLIVTGINGLLIIAIVIVLIVTPAVGGTLSCDPLKTAGDISIACGVLALVTALCYLICYCSTRSAKENMDKVMGAFCCVACIPFTVVVGLITAETAFVAEGVQNGTFLNGGGELVSCKNTEIPIILTAFSWVLFLLLFGCASLSFFFKQERQRERQQL